ncbi:HepT-like ribonuclease domain-containing protein [Methanospirillum stamsii]|uniref:DUF86 domain-containing protein n=1 Tax=Methanospirillum stamsii TaxID=1277351 RepID=A0A2V2NIR4_9EURY|nr:hypothetical protein DLD82_05070 [Methanospirillum stamsii]
MCLEAIDRIEEFTSGCSYDEFCRDLKTISAVRDQLMIIGESAKNIPDDLKSKYPQIPWEGMVGSRNILIHQYFRTDTELLFSNVQRAIGDVRNCLKKIISDIEETNSGDL